MVTHRASGSPSIPGGGSPLNGSRFPASQQAEAAAIEPATHEPHCLSGETIATGSRLGNLTYSLMRGPRFTWGHRADYALEP